MTSGKVADLTEPERYWVKVALDVKASSYSPYSKYAVGCTLVDINGRIHTGCNVESISFTPTICAERAALVKMVSEGIRQFRVVVVAASSTEPVFPCGVCRQHLDEFHKDAVVIAVDNGGTDYWKAPLKEFFPYGMKKEHLAQ